MTQNRFLQIVSLLIISLAFGCTKSSPTPAGFSSLETGMGQRSKAVETHSPNRLALARQLVDKDFYDVALVQLKAAIKEKTSDAMAYDLAGVCARELGDYKASETYLKKAAKLAPENASVYNNLGILYSITGEPEKAGKNLRQAVILDPGRPDYINNLGYFYLDQKQFSWAEQAFAKALGLNPDFEAARNNLIICLGLQHKDNEAMELLLSRFDEQTAWHNMACIYTLRDEPEKAAKLRKLIHGELAHPPGSAFGIQEKNALDPQNQDPYLPGDVAHEIYTKKYMESMKSDQEMDAGSSPGGQ